MVAAHLAEDQSGDSPTAIIGMSADSTEVSAYTRPFAYLRERSRVSYDETVSAFIHGNHDRLIEMSKHGLFPPGIIDRIKKLGESVMLRGIIVCDLDTVRLESRRTFFLILRNAVSVERRVV
jgi:hypothetical protein